MLSCWPWRHHATAFPSDSHLIILCIILLLYLFPWIVHSSMLAFLLFSFVFLSVCYQVQVLRTTQEHKFYVFYSHTEQDAPIFFTLLLQSKRFTRHANICRLIIKKKPAMLIHLYTLNGRIGNVLALCPEYTVDQVRTPEAADRLAVMHLCCATDAQVVLTYVIVGV